MHRPRSLPLADSDAPIKAGDDGRGEGEP